MGHARPLSGHTFNLRKQQSQVGRDLFFLPCNAEDSAYFSH